MKTRVIDIDTYKLILTTIGTGFAYKVNGADKKFRPNTRLRLQQFHCVQKTLYICRHIKNKRFVHTVSYITAYTNNHHFYVLNKIG